MKLLLLHNTYQHSGGEDAVVKAEFDMFSRCGHELFLYEVSNNKLNNGYEKLKTAFSLLYSYSSKKVVADRILAFKPDIVHVHNFFPLLTPSIYDACYEMGVPVVQTLHNYRLACPNAMFFYGSDLCEVCLEKTVAWPAIWRACYRESRLQTLAVVSMLAVHKLRSTWFNRVNAFIALTEFQRSKLIRAGLPEEKIVVKPNFVIDHGIGDHAGEFSLFVGRLSSEKGLHVIIDAYIRANLSIPLIIVGSGPSAISINHLIDDAGISKSVTLLGPKDQGQVIALMKKARLLIFPSVCYEGFPLTIAEAFACGLPVIASDIGSISEIIEDGRNGWLFEAGNPEALARVIKEAWDDPAECKRRGRAARAEYLDKYTPEINYQQLMEIYESVIKQARN